MKHIVLLVILMSCFPAKAQRLISGDQDLAVVVEITGSDNNPSPMLYANVLNVKVKLKNKSNRTRTISIMTCSWDESWVSKGNYGFCPQICEKNNPTVIDIPVGQTLVFYGTLCRGSNNKMAYPLTNSSGNRLGFMDFKVEDFGDQSKTVKVYWSNEFANKRAFNTQHSDMTNGPYYQLSKTGN
jgi:hypothetical protein